MASGMYYALEWTSTRKDNPALYKELGDFASDLDASQDTFVWWWDGIDMNETYPNIALAFAEAKEKHPEIIDDRMLILIDR